MAQNMEGITMATNVFTQIRKTTRRKFSEEENIRFGATRKEKHGN